jgi:hypothetical protein
MSDYTSLSVRELKNLITSRKLTFDSCVEKSDLIRILADDDKKNFLLLSNSELKDVIRHLAGMTAGIFERKDLFERAKQLINLSSNRCSICLDSLIETESTSQSILCLPCCATTKGLLHRTCFSAYVLSQVEDGKYPVRCMTCSTALDDYFRGRLI